jgi:hypothetical protein
MLYVQRSLIGPKLFSRGACRGAAQAIGTQTLAALDRHRQAEAFIGAPAGVREAAGEFGAATGTDEAPGSRVGFVLCLRQIRSPFVKLRFGDPIDLGEVIGT